MSDDAAWRASVPGLVDRCTRLWSLTLGDPLAGAYLAAVYGCTGPHGEDLVLKVSPPLASPAVEARALAHWDGHGAAKLVAFDEAAGALLLERVRPGTLLMELDRSRPDDELAIRAASGALKAMQAVPSPPASAFPSFDERWTFWMEWAGWNSEPRAAGTPMLPLLQSRARALDATVQRRTLVHGDFVAKNLLRGAGDRYVAVDPLPFMGDPCSDVGHFSSYHTPVATVIPRARAIAQACGLDPDRAAKWAAIWTVLEATETWREDSDDLQAWVVGEECRALLENAG